MTIGVLAVQGNFREHAAMLRRLGAKVVLVRKSGQLEGLDGLVIPGGESTTITRLARIYGLEGAIRRFTRPILGTCAGMILLDRAHLGLLDLEVERNAYGRQVHSFEADLEVDGEEPLRGVFIRAPRVASHGPDVEVLAEHDGDPVLLRQGQIVVAAFHPELTDDTRVHQRFLDLVAGAASRASDVSLESGGRGHSADSTGPRVERRQRREAGGAGLRPAEAGRSGARDVGA
jgi:pyridoxal 5'-phosphate synthase pdxT subunit